MLLPTCSSPLSLWIRMDILEFTSLSVLCPGGTSYSKAFYSSHIYNLVQDLPHGFFAVGDNAYTLSNTLLIPCSGKDKQNPSKDALNFYLTQLRIRIEQAFGLLVSKWRVFIKPLEVSFCRTTMVIEAAFRLHNYCIDMRDTSVLQLDKCDPEAFRVNFIEHLDPLGDTISVKAKRHAFRQAILQQIKSDSRKQPHYNVIRISLNVTKV